MIMEAVDEVGEYISRFPAPTQKKLNQLRKLILKAAPGAEELISYKMPSYKLHGPLVYFAGYDHHIGFYAIPSAILRFKTELKNFKTSKGTVQFPLDQPLPADLITKMVKFRVAENFEKKKK